MKHLFLGLAVVGLAATTARAQTERGTRYLSLSVSELSYIGRYGNSHYIFTGALTPAAGVFVANKLLVGAGLRLAYSRNKFDNLNTQYYSRNIEAELAPFVRYYLLGQRQHRVFGQLSAGHGWSQQATFFDDPSSGDRVTDFKVPARRYTLRAGLGYNYFLTPSAAFEARLGWRYQNTYRIGTGRLQNSYNAADLQLGFSVLLPSGKTAPAD
jgi:hypothetical protein